MVHPQTMYNVSPYLVVFDKCLVNVRLVRGANVSYQYINDGVVKSFVGPDGSFVFDEMDGTTYGGFIVYVVLKDFEARMDALGHGDYIF